METTIMENQMEKKMEFEMETTIMENQMEKKMENEMETREYIGLYRIEGSSAVKNGTESHNFCCSPCTLTPNAKI